MGESRDFRFPASKIGVAVHVDKGSSSVNALKWALDNENLRPGDTLHLLHVYSPVESVRAIGPGNLGDTLRAEPACPATLRKFQDKRARDVERVIARRYKSLCDAKDVNIEVHYGESNAVQSIRKELLRLINDAGLTRIVLGSNEHKLSRLFRGQSIPSYVAKNSPDSCKVVVIRNGNPILDASDLRSSSQISAASSAMSESSSGFVTCEFVEQFRQSSGFRGHDCITGANDSDSGSSGSIFTLSDEEYLRTQIEIERRHTDGRRRERKKCNCNLELQKQQKQIEDLASQVEKLRRQLEEKKKPKHLRNH